MSNEINLQEFKMHEKDSGSSSYQIAHLTQRIAHLTDHLSTNKHDVSSRRGLLKMVALRRKLLDYVKREDLAQYQSLIDSAVAVFRSGRFFLPRGKGGSPYFCSGRGLDL